MHVDLFSIRPSRANKESLFVESSAASLERRYNPKERKEMSFWRRHMRHTLLAAAVVGLVLLTSRVSASSSRGGTAPPKELYSCINGNQPDQQLTTYKDFAFQKPAR
jgi:hypothetical protein